MLRFLLLCIAVHFCFFAVHAASASIPDVLSVPSVLSNGMLLQQQKPIPVWGQGVPGRTVTVNLQSADDGVQVCQGDAHVDAAGLWAVALPPLDASFREYNLVIADSVTRLVISRILVGEVWLAGGQSNMQLSLPFIIGGERLLANAHNSHLRFFCQSHIPDTSHTGGFSTKPVRDVSGGAWVSGDHADGLRAHDVSGIGYAFAQTLFQSLNADGQHVPVAVLNTATGATSIQAWLSQSAIQGSPELAVRYPKVWYAGSDWQKGYNQATAEFNHKIAPLANLSLRGFLWAQGENDVGGEDAAAYYRTALATLIGDWRRQFHAPDAPFIAAQLAPHFYYEDPAVLAGMREAQMEACALAGNAIAMPIHDIPLTWNVGPFGYKNPVHPLDKVPVGVRLARIALVLAYHKSGEYTVPVFSDMTVNEGHAILQFQHTGGGLETRAGETLRGFTVCGRDRVFFPAEAQIAEHTVVVHSPSVPHPIAVAYGYTSLNQDSSLFSKDGLPASPFRTDKIASRYFSPQPWMDCDTNTQWINDGTTAKFQPCWKSMPGSDDAKLSVVHDVHGNDEIRMDYTASGSAGHDIIFQPVMPHAQLLGVFGGLRLNVFNPDGAPISLSLQLQDTAGKIGHVIQPDVPISAAPDWSLLTFRFEGGNTPTAVLLFTLRVPPNRNGGAQHYILLKGCQFIPKQQGATP